MILNKSCMLNDEFIAMRIFINKVSYDNKNYFLCKFY